MQRVAALMLVIIICANMCIVFSACNKNESVIQPSENIIASAQTSEDSTVQEHTTTPKLPDRVVITVVNPPDMWNKIITDSKTVNALRSAIDNAEKVKDPNQVPRGGSVFWLTVQINDKLFFVEKEQMSFDGTYYTVNEDLLNTLLEIYKSCDAAEYTNKAEEEYINKY